MRLTRVGRPNSTLRGEISTLTAARTARRRGLATALMDIAEGAAWVLGLRLVLLDTPTDRPARPFCRARGWRVVAVIEDYAARPDGEPAPTTIRQLGRPVPARCSADRERAWHGVLDDGPPHGRGPRVAGQHDEGERDAREHDLQRG